MTKTLFLYNKPY